jgi:glycosyltransferase involved in cell wall biosynthesis
MTQNETEKPTEPMLSFGLPVRNGASFIRRALESLEAQDFDDFEVVVCDNQSTDETGNIVTEVANRDPRFKYYLNETNIGQVENFNRVFELSRGRYFRWLGFDDQLEPNCARRCVEALEANPDAIGVFTFWRKGDDEGNEELTTFKGNPLHSKFPLHRIADMLWALQIPIGIDPMYSTLRRSLVEKTGMLPVSPWNDRAMAMDLALNGPFCHIDEFLSTRRESPAPAHERLAEFHPSIATNSSAKERLAPRWTMYRDLAKVVLGSSLSLAERALGTALVVFYGGLHHARSLVRRTVRLIRPRRGTGTAA